MPSQSPKNRPSLAASPLPKTHRGLARLWREQKGAVSVEFAVLFPVILLLIALIAYASLLLAALSELQHIAHELARASFRFAGDQPPDICALLKSSGLFSEISSHYVTFDSTRLTLPDCPGQPDNDGRIHLKVQYNFTGDYLEDLSRLLQLNIGTVERSAVTRF